ncbi:MAG: hypothetical protein COZ06_27245 [Armatimonadetes bacterium CG_4_10_14_3_um_filter_66_18]|nr:hypothetical protein [Armatimonadota bacterium]OIP10834.1 MAG: hypothetical protein AUJ96_03210 [Armatimonadetes bacterium CG2_30_66_41]PIU90887.1 MAG: hypothetical protein COS65_23790 [Armatimonadetes bacterium CG06_land_8_20_14_3_00_66_21]PIX38078.1 MAG: hypothetical protein COZ57_31445 [Armatimonadetes bacterium CG_4_8_14_3_um_filter_66_20]PIY41015.1 MAG: hypothetical protein COZ06_27245 [Armatimonadetes bacterium CG_4_10_14_3_um_filter_66_18]PIZ49858.1 MAG: hypothetical protein COY42_02
MHEKRLEVAAGILLALCVLPVPAMAGGTASAGAAVSAPQGQYVVGEWISIGATAAGHAEAWCTESGEAGGNAHAAYFAPLMGVDAVEVYGAATLTGFAYGSVVGEELFVGADHLTEPDDVGDYQCNSMALATYGYVADGNVEGHHDCDGFNDCPDHAVPTMFAYSIVEPEEPPGEGALLDETPQELLTSVILPSELSE